MMRAIGVLGVLWGQIVLIGAGPAFSQTIEFTTLPEGFRAGSIGLPAAFTGALGADPTDDRIVYASVGTFGEVQIARIDLETENVTVVAEGPFGSVAGIAPLSATQIAIVDNGSNPAGPPDRTILLASDLNQDGDFNDAGEVGELIAPILVDGPFGFSGAQARLVPPGNPSGIPSGSVVYQTADDNGNAELLVIEDPLGTPAYRPDGGAYFSGFDFNGGFDFDSQGRLMMGTATIVDATFFDFDGQVIALVNTNGDEDIDPGEFNILVETTNLPDSITDLSIDREDDVFCASGQGIDFFRVPNDPLNGTAAPSSFALTDAGFLSAVLVSSKNRPFEPFSGANGAALLTGGFTGGFEAGTNLLTLTPDVTADLNGDEVINSLDLYLFMEQWQRVTEP